MEIFLALLILGSLAWSWRRRTPTGRERPYRDTPRHYRRHLSRRNFLRLGVAVTGTAVLAYSGADEAVEEWHTREVKGDTSNRFASFFHDFGERYWFGVWAALALIDGLVGRSPLSQWGRRSSEAMVLGLPVLWTAQRGLGAARPKDETHGPRFKPLADDNTASGHTFISAVPLLVAARMVDPNALKALAYALSPWTGWSRMNDRKHYLSQVLFGYGIAWTAVETVFEVSEESASGSNDPEAPTVTSAG